MKQWFNVECDLYVHKNDVINMENGHAGIGYKTIENNMHEYELINKHAFQPITSQHVLSENSYSVVFILK